MNRLDFFQETVARVPAMAAGVVVLSKATLLLAVVWLIHFALAKADPRWRVLLWRWAAAGLLLLAVWTIGLPGYTVHVEGPEAVAAAAPSSQSSSTPPVVAVSDPAVLTEFPPHWVEFPSQSMEAPVFDEMTTAAVQPFSVDAAPEAARPVEASRPPVPWRAVPWRAVPWRAVLAGIWATGVVLLVVRLAVAYVRLASLLRYSQSAPDAVVAEVGRIAAALGYNRVVRVCRSERFAVPFLYGLRRPVLVLPQPMCETSYRSQLPGILAHELAHTRSRDLIWNAVLQAVSIGLWFHPLAWRIGWAHHAACDRVADAVSAAYLGDVLAYCQTLARVALEAGSAAPSVGLAMAGRSDVRRRLALLQWKVFAAPLKRRLVAGVGLAGLMVFGLLAGVRFVVAEAAAPVGDKQPSQTDSPVAEKPGVRPMRIEVLDPEGNPIVGAGVIVRGPTPTRFLATDAEGMAQIEVSAAQTLRLSILVWHDEYVTAGLNWPRGTAQQSIPADYTLTLARGTVLGGIVRNEQGEPLADAEVTVSGSMSPPGEVLWWSINDRVRSDAQGKWSSRRIPEDLKGFSTTISVRHPSCVGRTVFEVAKLSVDELRARTAVMVVRNGITLEGTVTDPEGKPVAGATVGQFTGYFTSRYPRATTDQNGRYRLAGCASGECILAAAAEGYAPQARRVEVTEEQRSFDLQLPQGEPFHLQVVDTDDKPIARAVITLAATLTKSKAATLNRAMWLLEHTRNPTTDADGRWSRSWIPGDQLEFLITKDGYNTQKASFAPDKRDRVVTLATLEVPELIEWNVTGRTVDRETREPLTKFHVALGQVFDTGPIEYGSRVFLHDIQLVANKDGRYRRFVRSSRDTPRAIRIEAEGYLPSDTLRLMPRSRSPIFNVELVPVEPVTGVVLSPDGKPLADAEVALYSTSWGLFLENDRPNPDRERPEHLSVHTTANGRFSLTPQREPYALMVMHDEGFARVESEKDMKTITIGPWARVEGILRIGSKPAAGQLVTISPESSSAPGAPIVSQTCSATTDERGRFTFDRVLSGKGRILRRTATTTANAPRGIGPPTHSIPATFVAGETTQVELSRDGRPVIGQIHLPDLREGVPWRNFGSVLLYMVPSSWRTLPPPGIPFPVNIDPEKDRDRATAWWETWKDTEQGRVYQKEVQLHRAIMWDRQSTTVYIMAEPDGSFLFEDMPAGEYRLTARVHFGATAGRGSFVYGAEREFTIPQMPGGRSDEPLDVGDLTLGLRDN